MNMQTQRQRPPVKHFQSRSLSNPFFNTPIGKIIGDAICNDFTYILNKDDSLVVGEVKTNNVEIVYNKNQNKPMVKSNPVRYEDSLYLDKISLTLEDVIYETIKPNIEYSVLSRSFNKALQQEFDAIWTTKVYVDNEFYQEYSQKIRFIPNSKEGIEE